MLISTRWCCNLHKSKPKRCQKRNNEFSHLLITIVFIHCVSLIVGTFYLLPLRVDLLYRWTQMWHLLLKLSMVKTHTFGIFVFLCIRKAKVTDLVLPDKYLKTPLILSSWSKVFLQMDVILLWTVMISYNFSSLKSSPCFTWIFYNLFLLFLGASRGIFLLILCMCGLEHLAVHLSSLWTTKCLWVNDIDDSIAMYVWHDHASAQLDSVILWHCDLLEIVFQQKNQLYSHFCKSEGLLSCLDVSSVLADGFLKPLVVCFLFFTLEWISS